MAGNARKYVASAAVVLVATAIAYLASSGALFWGAASFQIALFAGAVAGLAASSVLEAATVGPLTLVATAAFFPPWYLVRAGSSLGLADAVVLLGVCAVAALGVSLARFSSGVPVAKVNRAVSAALLVMVVVNMWATTLTVSYRSTAQNGSELAAGLQRTLEPLGYTSDSDQYLRQYQLMKAGTPYYEAVRTAWLEKRFTESLPWGVVSYRLPTLFWLWQALPGGATALIPAFLFFSTIAIVSAYLLPAQLGLVRLAPVSAALVAANYLVTSVSLFLLYVDPWGMALTLLGFALVIAAEKRASKRLAIAAVVAFIAAALIREILIYVPVAFALSTLILPRGQRFKAAAPWLAGIGTFAVAYLAHVAAIGGKVAPTRVGEVWTQGSIASLQAAVNLGQELMMGRPWILPAVLLLGAAGAAALWRAFDRRIAAVTLFCTTVPLLSLAFLGNPGSAPGAGLVNYWGMLCIPLNLALAPVALLLWRRPAPAAPASRKSGGSARRSKKARPT